MENLHFHFITVATPAYDEMIDLRMQVLLDPVGIPRSYINPQKEAADLLIGAYENDVLLGCCILTRISNTIVQLRQMAVENLRQKKGVGAALLLFAESTAKEKGYETIMLHARDTVTPFYEKCGYKIIGLPFTEVGIGHHKMQKELSSVK